MSLGAAQVLRPVRTVLPGGAVVLAARTGVTPAVTISLLCRAGSLHEPTTRPGLAHLTALTLDRGTARRSSSDIADDLDGRGVALQTAIDRSTLSLTCTCLSDDLADLLDLLLEIFGEASFPQDEVERKRTETLTTLLQDEDNTAIRAERAMRARLFGADHALGRPVRGTRASVASIARDDIVAFHRAIVDPSFVSLAVVGEVDVDRAAELAARAMTRWRVVGGAPSPAGPAIEAPRHRSTTVVPMMNKAQVDLAYGFVGVGRTDPEFYACWVMNTILGEFGLGGRLGDRIREREGMAYYAFSGLEADLVAGPLAVRAGVSAEHVEATLKAIDEEIDRLLASGVTSEELTDTKRYLIGAVPRALETDAGIAAFLQQSELFGLGLDHDRRLPDLIGQVTAADVLGAARRLLDPARATIAVAGPYEGPLAR